jgi:hypothetical protein
MIDLILEAKRKLFDSYDDVSINSSHFIYVSSNDKEYLCADVASLRFWIEYFSGRPFKVLLDYSYGDSNKARQFPLYERQPNAKHFILE